jgi:hypothetical protein
MGLAGANFPDSTLRMGLKGSIIGNLWYVSGGSNVLLQPGKLLGADMITYKYTLTTNTWTTSAPSPLVDPCPSAISEALLSFSFAPLPSVGCTGRVQARRSRRAGETGAPSPSATSCTTWAATMGRTRRPLPPFRI